MKYLMLVALFMLSSCADASQTGGNWGNSGGNQAATKSFAGLYFSPTSGKVGYHMVSNNFISQSPCAADEGYSAGSGGSRGGPVSVEGIVPPGLMPPDALQGRYGFDGTPRQAGDWDVKVTYRYLHCGSKVVGEDAPDLTTTVHFHIDP